MTPFSRFLLAAVALIGPVANSLLGPPESKGNFTLTVLEIPDIQRGAGLAIILQTPNGQTWLYDTGSAYPSLENRAEWDGNFNAGRDLIVPFLKQVGVTELDGVMISHAHYDHFGGLMWLADHFPIKKLVDSGYHFGGDASIQYSVELGDYDKERAKFQAQPGKYQAAHTAEKLALDPALEVEVLAPPAGFFSEPHPETRPKTDPPAHYLVNSNSLAVRIKHGSVVFYLPGDIQSEDIDQSLLPSLDPAKLKCDVLIAPGHGIHCTKAFAEATRPAVSIASVFPRYARGLKSTPLLKAVGAKTYITGLNGNVQVVSDGKTYHVTAQRDDSAAAVPAK